MRVVVCVLLLSGLLAGLTEGYSVQRTPEWRVAPQTVQYQPWSSKQDDNSEQDDQSFIASEETEEDKLWTFDEDPDWTPLESQESHENDGSFIASEETEEGELWSSDEDPDWTPSESQENEGEEDYSQEDYYSQEDDYTHEDYSQEDDYTQEDYSQENDYTQEDYSQEGDYTHEVSSQEDDYTQEVYSQEDDYSQEHHSQEDDYNQIPDDQPFPDVFVPGDHGVNAEFWQGGKGLQHLHDDWPQLQDQDQDYSRRKRDVKGRYQTGSQVVQVPGVYGSEQDTLDSGLWGGIQEGDGGRPGVSTGVEPLLPVGGPSQHDVGEGVEPEGVTSDKDEESRGSSVGDWFREGWRSFTGTVEDIGDKVIDVAGDVTGGVRDLIHHTYHGVRDKVSQLVDRFKVLIRKFGILVQEGVLYCLRRFERAVDQVQESTVFEKLEKELENGHAEVTKFFQILGEKVQAWNEQHRSENIDAGLIGGHTQQGQSHQEIDNMPDFLQDQQVQVQLNKLADVGVLTQQDIIILTEEHLHQDQQNQQQNQQEHQQDQQQNQNYDSQQQNQQQGKRNYQQQDQYNPNPKFIRFPE